VKEVTPKKASKKLNNQENGVKKQLRKHRRYLPLENHDSPFFTTDKLIPKEKSTL